MIPDELLDRIASGEAVPARELLPYLTLERLADRATVNTLLARAYSTSGRAEQAHTFVRRAWFLSGCSADLLPLYVDIHAAVGDIDGIREAYKRLGIAAADRGDAGEAIHYFNLWQYAYHAFQSIDRFEYDFDVLAAMRRLVEPYRAPPSRRSNGSGRLRIAYLLKGIVEQGSVLVKINLVLAEHHDRSRIEPLFFVPEAERLVRRSAAGREHVRLFRELGFDVHVAPDVDPPERRLLATSQAIRDANPDLLVTSAALADFSTYFVAATRPAPVTIGFVQGPPPQFAPPELDRGVAWIKHPLMDTPVDCTQITLEVAPKPAEVVPLPRSELGVPEEASVLASAGRYVKFQEPRFWGAVADVLRRNDGAHYLVLGAKEEQIPFLADVVPSELRPRIHFVPWQGAEYIRALAAADVVVDTFPSGGGVILIDAMTLGIPVVTFENDYMRTYDQTDWSLAEELVGIPELMVPRWDLDAFKALLAKLFEDEAYRAELGRRCRNVMLEERSSPERFTRRCEDLFMRVHAEAGSASWGGVGRHGARPAPTRTSAARALRTLAAGVDRVTWLVNGGARALRRAARALDAS